MKHILFFGSIAFVFLIFSCKKEAKPEDLILGKWKVTKLIVDGEDIVAISPDYQTQVEVEFTKSGTVVFNIKNIDYTKSPAELEETSASGTYSWDGGKITISVDDVGDLLSVTGNVDVTENRLLINATSGDTVDFFSLLEADKL